MSKCASEGCSLDSSGCVSLYKILQSFGAPISEEQAWALCYGFAECYTRLYSGRKKKLFLVTHLKHIILHKDGYLRDETFFPAAENLKGRQKVSSEGKLVADLGVVIYRALEYGLPNEEERELSGPLEKLIDCMTSAEPEKGETDDEGIERDSGDSGDEHQGETIFTMKEALIMCEDRLSSEGVKEGVEEHYKAVIRAMVAEAVDLTTFLKKVAEGTRLVAAQSDLLSSEQDLHQLQSEDWAMLWKQVMKELREGVKLKKIDYTRTPLEYALTPYEMLMEDIRSRRYTLNKVMVNGDIPPRLKKDAHAIILDFIRSRPPLKKVSERNLRPLKKVFSPRELLMESIKQKEHRLNHVATPVRSRPFSMVEPLRIMNGVSSSSSVPVPLPRKKLISAPRFNLSAEDEDEDDDLSDIPPSSPRLSPTPLLGGTMSSAIHTHASLTTSPTSPSSPASGQTSAASPLSRVAFDLAVYGGGGKVPGRRHSISICETPAGNCPGSGSDTPQNISGFSSRGSPMGSPQHQMLASTSKTQRDFLSSAHFSSRLDCLSLTLEEVVHIRNVLTKADLDALPLDLSIKEDVEKGKICFLCMKTRFGFFAPRGRECRLCKRIVCKKCVTKMRIPTERFSNIPVIMLTPQALSPKDDDEEYSHASLPRTFLNMLQDIPKGTIERRPSLSASVGSAPSSPASLRSSQGPASLHSQSPAPCVNQDIQNNYKGSSQPKKIIKRAITLSVIEESRSNAFVGDSGRFGFEDLEEEEECNFTRSYSCRYPERSRENLISQLPFNFLRPSPMRSTHAFFKRRKQELRQKNLEMSEKLRGELMAVCLDCKAMVIHVLLSIKLQRDNPNASLLPGGGVTESTSGNSSVTPDGPRSHLHLNLTPVYN